MENREKNKFINYSKWLVKKNKSILIAYCILLVICMPLAQFFGSLNYDYMRIDSFRFSIMLNCGLVFLSSTIFGLIFSSVIFGYFFSKRKIDFVESLPLSKKQIVLSGTLTVLLLTVIPEVIIQVIGGVISLFTTHNTGQIGEYIVFSLIVLIATLTNVMIFILICQKSGKLLYAYISFFAINFSLAIIGFIFGVEYDDILTGVQEHEFDLRNTLMLSPVFSTFSSTSHGMKKIFFIIYIVTAAVIAWRVIKNSNNRISEKAETVSTSSGLKKCVIVLATIATSYVCRFIFGVMGTTSYRRFNIVFGIVVAVSLTCIMLELIFEKSFKNIKKIVLNIIILSVVMTGVLFGVTKTMRGMKNYVPSKSIVDKVAIFDSYYAGDDIKDLIEVNDSEIIDAIIKNHKNTVYKKYSSDDEYCVRYKLKLGITVTRRIYLDDDLMRKYFRKVMLERALDCDVQEACLLNGYAGSVYQSYPYEIKKANQFKNEFIVAYKTDLKKVGYRDYENGNYMLNFALGKSFSNYTTLDKIYVPFEYKECYKVLNKYIKAEFGENSVNNYILFNNKKIRKGQMKTITIEVPKQFESADGDLYALTCMKDTKEDENRYLTYHSAYDSLNLCKKVEGNKYKVDVDLYDSRDNLKRVLVLYKKTDMGVIHSGIIKLNFDKLKKSQNANVKLLFKNEHSPGYNDYKEEAISYNTKWDYNY